MRSMSELAQSTALKWVKSMADLYYDLNHNSGEGPFRNCRGSPLDKLMPKTLHRHRNSDNKKHL